MSDAYIRDSRIVMNARTRSASSTALIRDMTHLSETWLIYQRHDSFIRDMTHLSETWLIHQRHDSFIRDMTHSLETPLISFPFSSLAFRLIHALALLPLPPILGHDSFIRDMTRSLEKQLNFSFFYSCILIKRRTRSAIYMGTWLVLSESWLIR